MESIIDSFTRGATYLHTLRFSDVVDILVVAALIYACIAMIRRTNSTRVGFGIVVLAVVLWLSGEFGLTMVNTVLKKVFELGLIALVILFQPELRRLLEKVGSGKFAAFIRDGGVDRSMEATIVQTALACADMSATKTGALIVFERTTALNDQMTTGTIVNADATSELLRNIFYPKAPLHDGAVIVREGRIAAAGCMLPLSQNANLSRDLGMRHRAGIGMSEHSDAVVAIVSEETGSISVAMDGLLKRHLTPEMLEKILRSELMNDEDGKKRGLSAIFASIKGKKNEGRKEQ